MKKFVDDLKYAFYLVAAIGVSSAHGASYDDFFRAVSVDDVSTIQALIQRGFDANSRDDKGQTALFLALKGGSFKAAEALLKAPGIDVNALNQAGESALMIQDHPQIKFHHSSNPRRKIFGQKRRAVDLLGL